MFNFSPLAERHLNYMANQSSWNSPISSNVKERAFYAQRLSGSRLIDIAVSSACNIFGIGIIASIAMPLITGDSRTSIFSSKPDEVCSPCALNKAYIMHFATTTRTKVCQMMQTFDTNLTCTIKEYLDKPNQNPFASISNSFFAWSTEKLTDPKNTGSFIPAQNCENKNEVAECRVTNYFGQFIRNFRVMVEDNKNEALGYFSGLTILGAIITIMNYLSNSSSNEQIAIDELRENFKKAAAYLNEKASNTQLTSKEKAKLQKLAEGIISNQKKIMDEMLKLKLPTLESYEDRLALFKPVLDAAESVLNSSISTSLV